MIEKILGALKRCFSSPEAVRGTPVVPRETLLRDEYEAIPRGPGGVRRKRNSVRDLAARHQMSTAELMAAVKRTQ